MFRKKDTLVIIILLCLGAVIYGAARLFQENRAPSGLVEISAGGAPHSTVPLAEAREVRVEQAGGHVNIVEIKDGGVRMAYSTCQNQQCVEQGVVTEENWRSRALGRLIICLPNQVQVELALEDALQTLLEEDLPDV